MLQFSLRILLAQSHESPNSQVKCKKQMKKAREKEEQEKEEKEEEGDLLSNLFCASKKGERRVQGIFPLYPESLKATRELLQECWAGLAS